MFILDEAVELEVSKKKTATQEQVDEQIAGVNLGHNSIGGSTLETMSQARGMIANLGGGGAFGDLAATLPDVTSLLPEDVGEEEGVEEEAVEDEKAAADGAEAESPSKLGVAKRGQTNPNPAEEKWYDFDDFINKQTHALNNLYTTKISVFVSVTADLNKTYGTMARGTSAAQTFFKGEIAVVKNALDVAEAVMNESGAEALDEVKKRFSKQGSDDSKSSSANGGGEKPTPFSRHLRRQRLISWNTTPRSRNWSTPSAHVSAARQMRPCCGKR